MSELQNQFLKILNTVKALFKAGKINFNDAQDIIDIETVMYKLFKDEKNIHLKDVTTLDINKKIVDMNLKEIIIRLRIWIQKGHESGNVFTIADAAALNKIMDNIISTLDK